MAYCLGVIPYKKVLKRHTTIRKLDMLFVRRRSEELRGSVVRYHDSFFQYEVNIIRTSVEFLYGHLSTESQPSISSTSASWPKSNEPSENS